MNKFLLTATAIATIFAASPLLAMEEDLRGDDLRAANRRRIEDLEFEKALNATLQRELTLYSGFLKGMIDNYPYGDRWAQTGFMSTYSQQEIEQHIALQPKFKLEEDFGHFIPGTKGSRWDCLGEAGLSMNEDLIEVCVFEKKQNELAMFVPVGLQHIPAPFPHQKKSPVLNEQELNELNGLGTEALISHVAALEESLASYPHLSNPRLHEMRQERAEVTTMCQKALAGYRNLYLYHGVDQANILVRMAHLYKTLGKAMDCAQDNNIMACYDFADQKGHSTAALELAQYFDIVVHNQFKAFQWYTIASKKVGKEGTKREIEARIATILAELDERVEKLNARLKK